MHKWCPNISSDSLSIRNLPFQHFESHTFGYWSGRSIEVSSIWVNCHALSFWAAEQSNRERSLVLDFPLQPACLNIFETFNEVFLRLATKYFWDFKRNTFETINKILLRLLTKYFWDLQRNTLETINEILLRFSTKYFWDLKKDFWDFQRNNFETFNEILLRLSTKYFLDFQQNTNWEIERQTEARHEIKAPY